MRWEVLLLEPVNDWFLGLCKNDPLAADKVEEALDELAERGRSWAVRLLTGVDVMVGIGHLGNWHEPVYAG